VIGRAGEAARLDALLEAARASRSGSLLVSGDPGIGKSLLLEHAASRAAGLRVLRVAGAEAEQTLAFAALADLLIPLHEHLDALPGPQADALRGALALGPPVLGDRFTAYAGALSLLARAAEDGPLLLLVDDAHWLDGASLEALVFIARRLGAEGIALVLAARAGVSARADTAPLPRLALGGLTDIDATALLRSFAPAPPAPSVARALVAGAAGNPMALIELAGVLEPEQLAGAAPLPDPLPVGEALAEALLRPLKAFPQRTRDALLLASADDGAGPMARALSAAGLTLVDLEPAERVRLVKVGPRRTVFSHPLVRAAVYSAAPAPDRRAAHRAHAEAAQALGEGSSLDRRAWHLARAAAGPDETAAAELEMAAARAGGRTAHAAAAEALEAAARLSSAPVDHGRRLLAAGGSALAAGDLPRAGRLLDEVIALGAEAAQTVQAMAGRGHVEMFGGSTRRAIDMLVAAAERIAPISPEAAAGMLAQAILASQMRADIGTTLDLSERAAALVSGHEAGGPPVVAAATASASAFAHASRPAPEGLEQRLAEGVAAGDPVAYIWAVALKHNMMLGERYEEALAGTDGFIHAARSRSTPSAIAYPLGLRAEMLVRLGRFGEARAAADEGARIAEETGQPAVLGWALSILARAEAALGLDEDCRAHAAAARAMAEASDAASVLIFADAALGELALAKGDAETAVEHLAAADRRFDRTRGGHPLLVPFHGNLVEARIRASQVAEAARDLEELDEMARVSGAAWPAAAAARCRGLMAADDGFEEQFAAALALHALTPTPFERARTELCLGERLRRSRRLREARGPLEAARATFEALGAQLWAARTQRELRASGSRPARRDRATTEALTPQELQVALVIAEGATNREAATALFLSPKTIEYHLGHAFHKLGVRSRAELVRRMAGI
jgi:DNA-binding CsgD family transcriptional regulator